MWSCSGQIPNGPNSYLPLPAYVKSEERQSLSLIATDSSSDFDQPTISRTLGAEDRSDSVLEEYSEAILDDDYLNQNIQAPPRSSDTVAPSALVSSGKGGKKLRPRVSRNPRVRKHSRTPGTAEGFRLTAALSDLANDFPNIPVNDVEAFATRSTADRKGSASVVGRVKRPLNAFMLYRKAYQGIAKMQLRNESQDNQAVSRICGYSWSSLEPERIRNKFKALAATETRKHKEAHPEYKYIPRKNLLDQTSDLLQASEHNVEDESLHQNPNSSMRSRAVSEVDASAAPNPMLRPSEPDPEFPGGGLHQTYPSNGILGWTTNQSTASGLRARSQPASQEQSHHRQQASYSSGREMFTGPMQLGQAPAMQSLSYGNMPMPGMGFSAQAVDVNSGFIDPRLFSSRPVSSAGNTYFESALETYDSSWPWNDGMAVGFNDQMLPDLDEQQLHNAYLRGQTPDWKVEELTFPVDGDMFLHTEEWLNRGM